MVKSCKPSPGPYLTELCHLPPRPGSQLPATRTRTPSQSESCDLQLTPVRSAESVLTWSRRPAPGVRLATPGMGHWQGKPPSPSRSPSPIPSPPASRPQCSSIVRRRVTRRVAPTRQTLKPQDHNSGLLRVSVIRNNLKAFNCSVVKQKRKFSVIKILLACSEVL
jgi:hypothetical protein